MLYVPVLCSFLPSSLLSFLIDQCQRLLVRWVLSLSKTVQTPRNQDPTPAPSPPVSPPTPTARARTSSDSLSALLTPHTSSKDILLHLHLSSLSLPLPPNTLAKIRSAAQTAKRRLVIVLELPTLALKGTKRGKQFEVLHDVIGRVYGEAERGKRERGKGRVVGAVVDVLVKGWSVDIDPEGWETVLREQDVPAEGTRTVQGSGDKEELEYEVVALGGTFDHLHSGHKILLTMAAWVATRRLIVGITDEALLKNKKHHDLLQSLAERTNAVSTFLSLLAPSLELYLPPLQDVYGPTATDASITALVVSRETLRGAEMIDTEREKNGLNGLERFVIGVIGEGGEEGLEEMEGKMGSTAIRGYLAEKIAANGGK